MRAMTTNYPKIPKVSSRDLQFLVQEAKDLAFCTGFVMGASNTNSVSFAPLCLFPSPFPEDWFLKGKMVQSSLNLLLHRVSKDTKFLRKCLLKAAATDKFLEELFEIMNTVLSEGYKQDLSLGIFRMDYMLDTENNQVVGMKQVEMNTISSGLGSLVTRIQPIQAHMLKHINAPKLHFPETQSLRKIAKGLFTAWKCYGNPSANVLFVVEAVENNFADQRLLEYAVCAMESKIKIFRYTFKELQSLIELKDYRLFVGKNEVAVVYYRTGYIPNQYKNKDYWNVRLMLERSRAIQCPNVPLQLAGMKKVQQELTREGVLEMFLPDVSLEIIQIIKTLFAGQFSLDLTDEGERAFQMALDRPERYVLKPQREGGGNNIFGRDIVKVLQELKENEREAFVLMDLIVPPVQKNYLVRKKQPTDTEIDTIGELGFYGVLLGDREKIVLNYDAGHILRFKEHGVNEGGVAMGFGALSLPYLV